MWYWILKRYRRYFLLSSTLGVLGVIIAVFKLSLDPLSYASEIDFIVNEDAGTSSLASLLNNSAVSSILGAESNNIEQLLAIATSDAVITPSLKDTIISDNIKYILQDYIASKYSEQVEDAFNRIRSRSILTDNTPADTLLLVVSKIVYSNYNEKSLLSTSYTVDADVVGLSVKSVDPILSYTLSNSVYDKLSSYYITKQTGPQRQTYNNLKFKVDSFSIIISDLSDQLARLRDTRRSISSEREKVIENRLRNDIQINTVAYTKVLENFEYSDFLLRSKTPYLSIINETGKPILAEPKPYVMTSILYGFAGVIFGALAGYTLELADLNSRKKEVKMK